jgi:hypothetical protein
MINITTAADARRLVASARPFVPSPPSFHGTLEELVERFILPNLPSAESVNDFHAGLAEYVTQHDALFLLRAVRGAERRQVHHTRDGTRFKATDNAPAWWIHAALLQGYTIPAAAFANVIATLPTHFHDVKKLCGLTANDAGWHTAHIFNVNNGRTTFAEWSRLEVIARFVRNVHPCNYFLLPKTDWQQWGGDTRVLGYFGALYAERYRATWPAFLALAHADASALSRAAGGIVYSFDRGSSTATPKAGTPLIHHAMPDLSENVAVEYRASRLTFKRDVIEALKDEQVFRIITPLGTFAMTKADVYRAFPKMVQTRSYRVDGVYHTKSLPSAIEEFRVRAAVQTIIDS